MNVHLTLKAWNKKTGSIPVSTTTADSCPPSCGLFSVCYAKFGPMAVHWRKVTAGERGEDWWSFCDRIAALPPGQLWRHNQAGDLPGDGDRINPLKLWGLIKANKGKRGFTYTHKPMTLDNQIAIEMANHEGFTVNLSADNLREADELSRLDIAPVVTLLPADQLTNTTTPAGRKVVVCPAATHSNVTCKTCGLCQWQGTAKHTRPIIGFPAHGTAKRKASATAATL